MRPGDVAPRPRECSDQTHPAGTYVRRRIRRHSEASCSSPTFTRPAQPLAHVLDIADPETHDASASYEAEGGRRRSGSWPATTRTSRRRPSPFRPTSPTRVGCGSRALDGLQTAVCGLHGHDPLLHFEQGRMFLRCSSCAYQSPGWETGDRRPRPRFSGDAARHQLERRSPPAGAIVVTRCVRGKPGSGASYAPLPGLHRNAASAILSVADRQSRRGTSASTISMSTSRHVTSIDADEFLRAVETCSSGAEKDGRALHGAPRMAASVQKLRPARVRRAAATGTRAEHGCGPRVRRIDRRTADARGAGAVSAVNSGSARRRSRKNAAQIVLGSAVTVRPAGCAVRTAARSEAG